MEEKKNVSACNPRAAVHLTAPSPLTLDQANRRKSASDLYAAIRLPPSTTMISGEPGSSISCGRRASRDSRSFQTGTMTEITDPLPVLQGTHLESSERTSG